MFGAAKMAAGAAKRAMSSSRPAKPGATVPQVKNIPMGGFANGGMVGGTCGPGVRSNQDYKKK